MKNNADYFYENIGTIRKLVEKDFLKIYSILNIIEKQNLSDIEDDLLPLYYDYFITGKIESDDILSKEIYQFIWKIFSDKCFSILSELKSSKEKNHIHDIFLTIPFKKIKNEINDLKLSIDNALLKMEETFTFVQIDEVDVNQFAIFEEERRLKKLKLLIPFNSFVDRLNKEIKSST